MSENDKGDVIILIKDEGRIMAPQRIMKSQIKDLKKTLKRLNKTVVEISEGKLKNIYIRGT